MGPGQEGGKGGEERRAGVQAGRAHDGRAAASQNSHASGIARTHHSATKGVDHPHLILLSSKLRHFGYSLPTQHLTPLQLAHRPPTTAALTPHLPLLVAPPLRPPRPPPLLPCRPLLPTSRLLCSLVVTFHWRGLSVACEPSSSASRPSIGITCDTCCKWRLQPHLQPAHTAAPVSDSSHYYCGGGGVSAEECERLDDWIVRCVGEGRAVQLSDVGVDTVEVLVKASAKRRRELERAMERLGMEFDNTTQRIKCFSATRAA